MLATLQGQLLLGLARCALETQDDLLGGLGLLVEDGLGLTTVTALLSVVTTLTLGEQGGLHSTFPTLSACDGVPSCHGSRAKSHLASLVLGDLVLLVLAALLALAVRSAGFRNVDLDG